MKMSSWLSNVRVPHYTSQRNEDAIIHHILERLPSDNTWCVEFGASDGFKGSNTWNLIHKQGWNAVLIEPNPKRYDTLVINSGHVAQCLCENVRCPGLDDARSLDMILTDSGVPIDFALVSIDIDGYDYHVFDQLVVHSPRIVIIEHNKTMSIDYVAQGPNEGSSLIALVRLAKTKGYELVAANDLNGFFVRREYFPLFNIADNSVDKVWPDRQKYHLRLFQLYNGTIVFAGDALLKKNTDTIDRCLWCRNSISGQIKLGHFKTWIVSDDVEDS